MAIPDNSIIVTAANESYFELLQGLVLSIRHGEQRHGRTQGIPVKVLDLGLTPQQAAALEPHCEVHKPSKVFLPIEHTGHTREHLLSRAVKPFLKEYFPGYDVYTWLDADTWVQNFADLDLFMQVGKARGLALVPMVDRTYLELYNKSSELHGWMQPTIADSFGSAVASGLKYLPTLNAGVFSATRDSPIWEHYAQCLEQVFRKSRRVFDQPAFNVAIYGRRIPFYPLPSRFNWICVRSLPNVDLKLRALTAPGIPYEPLGIVHLTKRMTHRDIPVRCSDGTQRSLRLDYLGWQSHWRQMGLAQEPVATS